MDDYYCVSCGGDLKSVQTAYGPQQQCTACAYISTPLKIIDWRADCPICYEPHDSASEWVICSTCSRACCITCYERLTKCAFCSKHEFHKVQTTNIMSPKFMKHYAKLAILVQITFREFYEYLRWLVIRKLHNDTSPPMHFDNIWHAHILDTAGYRTCCEELVGTFIDHDPIGAFDQAARQLRLSNTHKKYVELFGEISKKVRNMWIEMPTIPSPDRPIVGMVHFHMLGRNTKYIPLVEAMTAGELKAVVASMDGICPDQIRLLKNRIQLTDDKFIQEGEDTVDIYATLILGGC